MVRKTLPGHGSCSHVASMLSVNSCYEYIPSLSLPQDIIIITPFCRKLENMRHSFTATFIYGNSNTNRMSST